MSGQTNLKPMLSVDEVKKILKSSEISDKEAEKIRDLLYFLADIALESFTNKKLKIRG